MTLCLDESEEVVKSRPEQLRRIILALEDVQRVVGVGIRLVLVVGQVDGFLSHFRFGRCEPSAVRQQLAQVEQLRGI